MTNQFKSIGLLLVIQFTLNGANVLAQAPKVKRSDETRSQVIVGLISSAWLAKDLNSLPNPFQNFLTRIFVLYMSSKKPILSKIKVRTLRYFIDMGAGY